MAKPGGKTAVARGKSTAKIATAKVNGVPVFICPECGEEKTSPAALGSHRKKKHGVSGSSVSAVLRQNRTIKKRKPKESLSLKDARARVTNDTLSALDKTLEQFKKSAYHVRAVRFELSTRTIEELISFGHSLAANGYNVNVYAGAKEFLATPAAKSFNSPVIEVSVKVDNKL